MDDPTRALAQYLTAGTDDAAVEVFPLDDPAAAYAAARASQRALREVLDRDDYNALVVMTHSGIMTTRTSMGFSFTTEDPVLPRFADEIARRLVAASAPILQGRAAFRPAPDLVPRRGPAGHEPAPPAGFPVPHGGALNPDREDLFEVLTDLPVPALFEFYRDALPASGFSISDSFRSVLVLDSGTFFGTFIDFERDGVLGQLTFVEYGEPFGDIENAVLAEIEDKKARRVPVAVECSWGVRRVPRHVRQVDRRR